MKHRIPKIIKFVNSRFQFPTVCSLYENLLSKENSDFEDFARIISIDPITTSTVLKIANSPLYGLQGQISELSKAIFVLGTKQISDLLYLDVTKRMSKAFSLKHEKLIRFWRQSLMIAFLSREIGKTLKIKEKETLFVSGLLSLIGEIPVIYLTNKAWIPKANDSKYPWEESKSTNGFAYNELSAEMLKSWGLSHKNIIPIQHAHLDELVEFNKNAMILQAAFLLYLPYMFESNFNFNGIIESPKIKRLGIEIHDLKFIYSKSIDLTEETLTTILSMS